MGQHPRPRMRASFAFYGSLTATLVTFGLQTHFDNKPNRLSVIDFRFIHDPRQF
jgi:hypothetical protein